MTKQLHIQPANLSAAQQLAQFAEQAFRDAFADDSSPDDMETYIRESFSLSRIQSELADEANRFFVAVSPDDALVGYAKLRAGTLDPSVSGSNPIELERIYVGQSAIGCGVGAALMQASLTAARLDGYRTLWLGVWERNHRAIAFYKRWGFEVVGDHVFRLGSEDQTDLVMERPVAPSGDCIV